MVSIISPFNSASLLPVEIRWIMEKCPLKQLGALVTVGMLDGIITRVEQSNNYHTCKVSLISEYVFFR
jgi:hypothetical protein